VGVVGDRIGGGGQDRRSYLIPSKQETFAETPHTLGAISLMHIYRVQALESKKDLNRISYG
jgi:hypothetical protein